jgi:predicted acylesterase/phospholipase RssA
MFNTNIENKFPNDILITLSGGGTRFIGIIAVLENIYRNGIKPKYIAGVSAGAIACLPVALGKWEKCKEIGLNLQYEDFFDSSPFTKKGSFKWFSILRFIFKGYLGKQNVEKLLKQYITERDFNFYQNCNLFPEVFIMAVSTRTQKTKIWNIKDESISYEKYLKIVAASCAIPIFTQPIEIDGELYYDGGLRDHNPSNELFRQNIDFKHLISVYTRDEEFERIDENWKLSAKNAVMSTANMFIIDVSESNEEIEKLYCELNKKDLTQIFIDRVDNNFYALSKEKMLNLYEKGKTATIKYYDFSN